jgi:hypothetical protein
MYGIKSNNCTYVYDSLHAIYLLHVAVTHVAILREVREVRYK